MELSADEIDGLLVFIKNKHGYDFTGYSRASITRRINRFMNIYKITDADTLRKKILSEADFAVFFEEMTVGVTEMFRDPSFFKSLREKVIPVLKTYPFVKIWIAGCSTGEEVYSLAILLKEENLYEKSKIYATDINPKVLTQAKDGIYSLRNMQDYTNNYIKAGGKSSFSNYYYANYDRAIFDSSLKKNIVFSQHNLVSDSSFNEFNLILCRNVFIYFGRVLQNTVLTLFVKSLVNLGFLALGAKETLSFSNVKAYFEAVEKNEKIYRKIK